MFHVTVVNLSADGRTVVEGGGPLDLGDLPTDKTTELLDAFAEIDPVQNVKADPEIRIQARRSRFIVRTGQKKLFLQDARNLSEPAYVMSASEVIAELDGSAAAKRTAPPMPFALPTESSSLGTESGTESSMAPVVSERSWPFALIGLVVLLAGYVGYRAWTDTKAGGRPAITPLTNAERLAEDTSLTGVYTTGSEPGQHGIIIMGDGRLKLFQVNAQAAPSVVYGSYRFGRVDSKLCLDTDQPGGLVKVIDRESLEFCGEIYRRIP